ncbi:DUF397 domain-containing protein [Streptomyces fulvoviolaceus]|uniref:DUF397 domain-containing protein n=1 Tax=Streptomyces fulvoviolaceus TaxID=285535 RepID=UPI0021BE808A|nr:DUF397 domain-containing protein [Streptomyces fulvoviolaceus]MCT9078973.1 DUF397 domain-containing protein [Streptomyces fulvoviolaceus]
MAVIPSFTWQKSTYSPDGSDCVYLASPGDGTILLQESDEPGSILATGPRQLRDLIASLCALDHGVRRA